MENRVNIWKMFSPRKAFQSPLGITHLHPICKQAPAVPPYLYSLRPLRLPISDALTAFPITGRYRWK